MQEMMAKQMAEEMAKMQAKMKAEHEAKMASAGGNSDAIQCNCKSLLGWIILALAFLVLIVGMTCNSGALAPCNDEGTTAAIFIIAVVLTIPAGWTLLGYYRTEKKQYLLVRAPARGPAHL